MRTILLKGRKGGLSALVDDEDFERLNAFPWYALRVTGSLTTYARTLIAGKTIYMHNMILPPKKGLETDHKDRNGLNNQRRNLRRVTHAINIRNSVLSDRSIIRRDGIARKVRKEDANVHRTTSRGHVYYYHRPTRIRLPDDPDSVEFKTMVRRLNRERKNGQIGKRCTT